jgi:hypothetical protein
MILKIILAIVGFYNIIWAGDYVKGLLALLGYEIIEIIQRLDKLENK